MKTTFASIILSWFGINGSISRLQALEVQVHHVTGIHALFASYLWFSKPCRAKDFSKLKNIPSTAKAPQEQSPYGLAAQGMQAFL